MENQEKSFDIIRFLQILFIHKWKFLIIFSFVYCISIFYILSQPKYYVSEYNIYYNETKEISTIETVETLKTNFDPNFWLNIMKSNEIYNLTIKNSGLGYNIDVIKRLITVELVKNKDRDQMTNQFLVTITSKNNEIIPILIKSYVQSLNETLSKIQMSNSDKLITFLSKQLNENDSKLGEIDLDMNSNNNNPAKVRDITKLTTDLSSFRTDLLNTQINLSSALASKQRTEQELKNLDGTIINESAFSEPLKVQLMNLQVDLARSLTINKENHPSVRAIRENISQLQKMIHDSIENKMEIKSYIKSIEITINVKIIRT